MGRSGTTMLQDVLASEYKLDNLGEYLTNDYDNKVIQLSVNDNWISKYFIEEDYDRNYISDINTIAPDIIVNSYRENLLDQYLSFQVSLYNKKWNSGEKMNYKSFKIDDPMDSIGYFKRSIELYNSVRLKLSETYDIINVSYEQLLSGDVDRRLSFSSPTYHTAKQNTLDEKINLIENFNEVSNIWDEQWQ